ncbi:hypothetical protein [Pseudomonas sp. HMWF021]|uniref:hypothetical protein n=1 Tax=Pseudomonas sp. HMWF021 TaxID=2056857 RepID=UPI000D397BB3|nr:hypothetical protein [Pseudomonas sp. HMWF021]PTT31933.1 hypothetical protein DBR18_06015 [Pseudomonas sp. HMWF021]
MSNYEANGDSPVAPASHMPPVSAESGGRGLLNLKVDTDSFEFSYRPASVAVPASVLVLPAPMIEVLEGGMLDPSLSNAFVRVAPYPNMLCGDKLVLNWRGLDDEGQPHIHETTRSVSEGQVGQEVVFVIKGVHIAALERGSLEIYWTLYSAALPEPVSSTRLQLDVGNPEPDLLAPVIEGVVGGTLDPTRVPQGANIIVRPYARMAAGDRIILSWKSVDELPVINDVLIVEQFAVGEAVSFWATADDIASHAKQQVSVSYRIESAAARIRHSAISQILIAPLIRGDLAAPEVLEAQNGELDVADAQDGVTVVIGSAQAEEGELVYLKCDGEYFSYRDERDITQQTAGQPLVFTVPYRFWREHRETTVQLSYSVERLDDASQASGITPILVRA